MEGLSLATTFLCLSHDFKNHGEAFGSFEIQASKRGDEVERFPRKKLLGGWACGIEVDMEYVDECLSNSVHVETQFAEWEG